MPNDTITRVPAPTTTRQQRTFTLTHTTRASDAPDAPIDVCLSSEAPVERYDAQTGQRYFEVLDHGASSVNLDYCRDGLPFCLDHDLGRVVGVVDTVRVDSDRRLRGWLRFGNHPDAEWIRKDVLAGIRNKVSIGYDAGPAYTPPTARTGDLPVRRYTRWTLYEASTVAVPEVTQSEPPLMRVSLPSEVIAVIFRSARFCTCRLFLRR